MNGYFNVLFYPQTTEEKLEIAIQTINRNSNENNSNSKYQAILVTVVTNNEKGNVSRQFAGREADGYQP
jgi:hypothetical protein